MESKKVIGIDLGTTNSLAAHIKGENVEIIPNERGGRTTPSVIYFKSEKNAIVGELAKNQSILDVSNAISNVKLKMGEMHRYKIRDREYTPSEISGVILRKVKEYSEKFIGEGINKAVITVPAYFNDNQRKATLNAANLCELNVLKLLNEPTAAALAYGFYKKEDSNILVIDIGGGTFDVTLMEYKNKIYKVKAITGNTDLGGHHFDQKIEEYIVKEFKDINGIDLRNDKIAFQQVAIQSEKAKIDLSSVNEIDIMIPYITMSEKGPLHLNVNITRERFENLIQDYLKSIIDQIVNVFLESEIDFTWVDSLILIGGTTRIPAIEKGIVKIFNENKVEVNIFRDINPDEAVAIGAGILSGIYEGTLKDIKFYDITSHSLGLRDDSDSFVEIISKGVNYPYSETKLFTTVNDNQEEVVIEILQSNDDGSNVSLGYFHLKELPAKKAGELNIDVTFNINENGVLVVSAIELDSGNTAEISIEGNSNIEETDNLGRRGKEIKLI